MFKRILFLVTLLGNISLNGFSQGESNIWYFGYNAGLSFNSGTPVALTNGKLRTDEGCTSISDAAGNLLFYTAGDTIWNKNHLPMTNGTGLMGQASSSQSAIIVKKPGNNTIYYVFTVDATGGLARGLRYSEVNMSLSSGLGAVTSNKNILLRAPSSEKLVAVRHCNKKDIWVVSHDDSTTFRAYLVTSAGVNAAAPVLSKLGPVVNTTTWMAIGNLKASPDGKKLAAAYHFPLDKFELYDFDNSTGIVSNAITLAPSPAPFMAYGVEFSPDATKLYCSSINGRLYQFNLCAGSATAIATSGTVVGSSPALGALQLGPDNKIYVARVVFSTPWVGVINNPNTLGTGCNYVSNGVSLAGRWCRTSLPPLNIIPYVPPMFTHTVTCLSAGFTSPSVPSSTITVCNSSTVTTTSYSWNFSDPSSGANNTSSLTNPIHVFSSPGIYNVRLILNYGCGSDTVSNNITINPCGTSTVTPCSNPPVISVSSTSVSCNGGTTGTAGVNITPGTGASPFTYQWSTGGSAGSVSNLGAGSYSVIISDVNNCKDTAIVFVTQPSPILPVTSSTPAGCGLTDGSVDVSASGGNTPYIYLWSTGNTTSTVSNLGGGVYSVTLTDANACTSFASEVVNNFPAATVSISSTSVSCYGGANALVTATITGGTSPYIYSWLPAGTSGTSAGSVSINNQFAGNYNLVVTDSNLCISSATVTITEPPMLATTINPAACTSYIHNAQSYTTGGIYLQTLTASGGCDSILTINLTINSNINTYGNQNICQGESVIIHGLSQNTAGIYTHTYTATSGCDSISAVQLNVNNPTGNVVIAPTCDSVQYNNQWFYTSQSFADTILNGSVQGCDSIINVSLSIINSSNTADTINICEGQFAIIHGVNQNTQGIYSQTFSASNSCDSVSRITLNIHSLPVANIGNDTTIISGTSITLIQTINNTAGNHYLWSTGATTATITQSPNSNSQYILTLTDSNNCFTTDTIMVTVLNNCDDNVQIFVPNSFSPNSDGQNDVLQLFTTNSLPFGEGRGGAFYFAIYSRWGEKVFESTDITNTWDGTHRGNPADAAVFTWVLKITCKQIGTEVIRTGNLSLIK